MERLRGETGEDTEESDTRTQIQRGKRGRERLQKYIEGRYRGERRKRGERKKIYTTGTGIEV
jgi:hypothetical protein